MCFLLLSPGYARTACSLWVLTGPIAAVSVVSGTLDWSSSWGGDGGVNVAGSNFDAEIYVADSGMEVGG